MIARCLVAVEYTVAVLSLSLPLSGCSLYTVRSLSSSAATPGPIGQSFDATQWAESIWASHVVPAVRSQAVDISSLLKALRTSPRAAERLYGHVEGDGPYNFIVKGIGTVTAVDTSSIQGTATIALPPPGQNTRVSIALGPVILGTTLRDGVGFIHFGQFVNQIQYAQAATALNVQVRTVVLKNVNPSHLKGKSATFYGIFSYSGVNNILIVPVQFAAGQKP